MDGRTGNGPFHVSVCTMVELSDFLYGALCRLSVLARMMFPVAVVFRTIKCWGLDDFRGYTQR